MKLRIKGDSLRFRLTQGEVQQLDQIGSVEDRTRFAGNAQLVYRLRRDASARAISAEFSRGAGEPSSSTVEVRIPDATVLEWSRTNEVTLTGTQATGAGGELRIVIEKDFACLTVREGEDESDNFPNPNPAC